MKNGLSRYCKEFFVEERRIWGSKNRKNDFFFLDV